MLIDRGDAKLTDAEIAEVTFIAIYDKNVQSLQGIEFFTALKEFECIGCKLTSIDISKNTALETLYCYSNQLTAIDVSQNTALTKLHCGINQLTSLDVSQNTALKALHCNENQLTSLDLSNNVNLTELYCRLNQIKGAEMDALIESLPTGSFNTFAVMNSENEGNVVTTTQVAAAKAKGWRPIYWNGTMWQSYAGSEPERLRGDVNGDGVVNGTDIQAIINAIVEGEYDEKTDVNEDGTVNGTDIQEVINIIVNAE